VRAGRIEATGFRNIGSLDLVLPEAGAVLLGPNGQGKTNLLEAIYYPVLFRSLRGARDLDLVRHGDPAFHLRLELHGPTGDHRVEAGFALAGRRKRIALDGAETTRLNEALGIWLAVSFLPTDVSLVAGGASERRQFLDRVLALSSPTYLRALRQYRAAVDQRNAALRRGEADAAWAFDPALARFGSVVTAERLAWVERYGPAWRALTAGLGEPMEVGIRYAGRGDLADAEAWPEALAGQRGRDLGTGTTSVGPHRDDLAFDLGDAPLRVAGSTGQQRTAAVALKLCERDTLEAARGAPPALLLDDVFAELDRGRQERLAERLGIGAGRQVFITAPRADELPPGLDLPVFDVAAGVATPRSAVRAA